jgi:hypothetical protein
MNPLSGPRQQQQKQQQKQKTLRIKKQGNTLEFHSRLIEAPEVRLSFPVWTGSSARIYRKQNDGLFSLYPDPIEARRAAR